MTVSNWSSSYWFKFFIWISAAWNSALVALTRTFTAIRSSSRLEMEAETVVTEAPESETDTIMAS